MIRRTIICDCCGKQEIESVANGGWSGWISVRGVVLNGSEEPNFCPDCKVTIMNYIDSLVERKNDLG